MTDGPRKLPQLPHTITDDPQLHQCNVCGVYARATTVQVAVCSRCQAAFYCSRDHQSQDFQRHRTACSNVKSARECLAIEEARLRKGSHSIFRTVPHNLFETHVGRFDQVSDTDDYMIAKLVYIQNLAVVSSPKALTLALEEAMDSLRLSRVDPHKVRDGIPVILLRLGKLQQCYDFIKWWTTVGQKRSSNKWRNLTLPYLDVHDAHMTEPITVFQRCKSVMMLAALAYIKVALAAQVEDVVHARVVLMELPAPARRSVVQFLSCVGRNSNAEDQDTLRDTLREQATAAMRVLDRAMPLFCTNVLEPERLLGTRMTTWNENDAEMQLKPWLVPLTQLWHGHKTLLREHQ